MTEGLSEIAGEAVELGLNQVGFGLSLEGSLSLDQHVWAAGDSFEPSPLALRANMYGNIEISDESLPPALGGFVEVTGRAYQFFQVGDGSPSTEVKELFGDRSPMNKVRTLSRVSTSFHAEVDVECCG